MVDRRQKPSTTSRTSRASLVQAPALEIRNLHVHYGASHALQGVDLALEGGVLSVVGRNGMGKTTLCKAIMGLVPASSGSIRLAGQELCGLSPADVARLGVGYVPQGRRLWRSLTVDEHLRLMAVKGGAWSVDRIYATFPRLAERKANGGAQLSGGEQQMLAISRALLAEPASAPHGRANRRARPRDRHSGRADADAARRGRRYRRPGDRAEHRCRDGCRRQGRDHGQRTRRSRGRLVVARGRSRLAAAPARRRAPRARRDPDARGKSGERPPPRRVRGRSTSRTPDRRRDGRRRSRSTSSSSRPGRFPTVRCSRPRGPICGSYRLRVTPP